MSDVKPGRFAGDFGPVFCRPTAVHGAAFASGGARPRVAGKFGRHPSCVSCDASASLLAFDGASDTTGASGPSTAIVLDL
jgi:hypothetical protein